LKAAVLHSFAEPLRIEEIPTPTPGPGEVLIKVAACGVCHSDLHLAMGEWDLLKPITKLPLTLGHEVAGAIASVGEGVTGFDVGDRVGVPWLHWTCGECEFCSAGRETLCSKQKVTGCMVDGGFAEFIKAKASHVARLPNELSFEEAAPLLCAGLTVHSAMKKSGAQAGQKVAIFVVGHVNGDNFRAIRLSKLNRQMAESAHAEDGDLLAGLNISLFHRAVNRKPGAEQRRGFFKTQFVRQPRDVARSGFDEFGEASVNSAAGDLLLRA